MFSRSFQAVALVAALPLINGSPILNVVEERGTCNADNLLRLLRTPTNLAESLPFCSNYLSLPVSTIIVDTASPTGTLFNTATSTISPTATSYTTDVSSSQPIQTLSTTTILTQTSFATDTTKTTTIATVSQALPPPPKHKRAKTPVAEQVTNTYDSSRISSACACLTIPLSIASVTSTAAKVTSTTTTYTTTTAPEVTQIITLSTTTILQQITDIVTLKSTTELTLTTTQTSVSVSTTTLLPAPTSTSFFLRAGNSANTYLKMAYFGNTGLLTMTSNINEAIHLTLDASKHLSFIDSATQLTWFSNLVSPSSTGVRGASFSVKSEVTSCVASRSCVYEEWTINPVSNALTITTPQRSVLPVTLVFCPVGSGQSVYFTTGSVAGSGCAATYFTAYSF